MVGGAHFLERRLYSLGVLIPPRARLSVLDVHPEPPLLITLCTSPNMPSARRCTSPNALCSAGRAEDPVDGIDEISIPSAARLGKKSDLVLRNPTAAGRRRALVSMGSSPCDGRLAGGRADGRTSSWSGAGSGIGRWRRRALRHVEFGKVDGVLAFSNSVNWFGGVDAVNDGYCEGWMSG